MLALVLGSAPIPCLAGPPPGTPSSPTPLTTSVDKAVHNEVAHLAKTSATVARQESANAPSSGGFLKSKVGIVTVVLLAAGTGFAVYSRSHDRVTSPKVSYGGTWK